MWQSVALAAIALAGCAGCASGDDDGPSAEATVVGDVPQVVIYGAEPGDHLSAAVTGDFNGDGTADIAVGAAMADGPDNQRTDAGEVYVFFGPLQAGQELDALSDADVTLYGQMPFGMFGRGLSAGDYNGDGTDDIVAAAPFHPALSAQEPGSGTIYVISGSAGLPSELDLALEAASATIAGESAGDGPGLALATEDFDEDGRDDLVIGAPLADGPEEARPEAGEVYVVLGSALAPGMTLPGAAVATAHGRLAGDHLGEAIAADDISGEGVPDIVAAAAFADIEGQADSGEVYVFRTLADLSAGEPSIQIAGADAGDQLGHSIAAADWDGDGRSDLWLGSVSADGAANGEDLAGEVHLFVTGEPGTVTVAGADGVTLGTGEKTRLGRNATGGELDGEAGEDAVFSAPDAADRRGELYVFSGNAGPPERASGAAVWLRGNDAGDILGHEAFGMPSLQVSDVDGDGAGDLISAAPEGDGPNNARTGCGEVYVLFLNSR